MFRKLTIVIWLNLMLVVSTWMIRAQQQQPPASRDQDDVIKVDTSIVQLNAVVTDRKGRIIDNLKQEDFTVSENATPQEIKFFSLQTVQSRYAGTSNVSENPTNTSVSSSSSRVLPARTVVLFVDTLHLSPTSLMRAKNQLRQFVDEQLTDNDLAAVIVTNGSLGVLQQFMRDRVRLKYAIDKISPFQSTRSLFSPFLAAKVLSDDQRALNVGLQILVAEEGYQPLTPEAGASYTRARAQEKLGEEMYFRRATLQTLKAVSARLATMKGQRMIAYISDGFTLADSGGGAERQDLTAATSRAVRAGVLIYTFNSKGLSTPVESQAASPVPMDAIDFIDYMNQSENDQKEVLREIADETGARAFLNRNDLHNMLNEMLEENRAYYSLAYYPQNDADKKKFRKIKVQIKNHPEYTVRVQNGYQPLIEKTGVAQTPQQALLQAMVAPLPTTEIGVTASANFLARADDEAQATLQVHIDGNSFQYPAQEQKNLLECELAVLVLDHQGLVADKYSEQIKAVFTPTQLASARRNGFRYDKRLDLKSGLYQVRVGVREISSGSVGTANSWLEIPDLSKRKLALSGLFFGQGRQIKASGGTSEGNDKQAPHPKLMTGQMTFKNGDSIFYRFVVYNVTPADGMLKIEINQGDAPIYDGDWQPLAPRIIRNDGKGLEAGGQFKATLPPGFYTLRVSVKDSHSKKVIQQTLDFEVSA